MSLYVFASYILVKIGTKTNSYYFSEEPKVKYTFTYKVGQFSATKYIGNIKLENK